MKRGDDLNEKALHGRAGTDFDVRGGNDRNARHAPEIIFRDDQSFFGGQVKQKYLEVMHYEWR